MTTFDKESPGYANRTAKKRGTDKVTASLPATPSKKAAIIKTIMNSPRTRTSIFIYDYRLFFTSFHRGAIICKGKKQTCLRNIKRSHYQIITVENNAFLSGLEKPL